MKRRAFLQHLTGKDCELVREGGNHSWWRFGVGAVHGGGAGKPPRARSWRQAERETDFAADGLAISDGLFGLGLGGVVSRIADEHAKGCEPADRRIESHPQWLRGQEEVE